MPTRMRLSRRSAGRRASCSGLADSDASARREAEDVLATYRRLQSDADSLRKLVSEARTVSTGAARLGERAFLPASKAESSNWRWASAVETIAAKRLESLTAQLAELEQRQGLACLLAEERSLEETRQCEERRWRNRTRGGACFRAKV